MTDPDPEKIAAEAFESQRGRLVAVAYRMLGSRTEAEDAVQEAWLRPARQDLAAIENVAGWTTTVVRRICVDALHCRRATPEAPDDDQLHELIAAADEVGGDAPRRLRLSYGLSSTRAGRS